MEGPDCHFLAERTVISSAAQAENAWIIRVREFDGSTTHTTFLDGHHLLPVRMQTGSSEIKCCPLNGEINRKKNPMLTS